MLDLLILRVYTIHLSDNTPATMQHTAIIISSSVISLDVQVATVIVISSSEGIVERELQPVAIIYSLEVLPVHQLQPVITTYFLGAAPVILQTLEFIILSLAALLDFRIPLAVIIPSLAGAPVYQILLDPIIHSSDAGQDVQ